MNTDRIWYLIGKKLAGEAGKEELAELETLLRSDPDLHYALQNITDIWYLSAHPAPDAEAIYQRHTNRLKNQEPVQQYNEDLAVDEHYEAPKPRRSYSKIAWVGSIASVIGISCFLIFSNNANNSKFPGKLPSIASEPLNQVSTRNGSRTKIVLPDGSQVWLNSGSNLTYTKEFGNRLREVELSGEAYFDVVKNPEQPFIIHTHQIDVKVVGTAFNVKSYPGERRTETTLIRGRVEVMIHNRPDEKIILKPNEKLVVVNDEVVSSPGIPKPVINNEPIVAVGQLTHYRRNDSIVVETAWVQNKLVFDNESFADVADRMQRWYNMEFEFRDGSVGGLHFTGAFTTETIQQALDAMSISAPFHYTIKGNKVILYR
jgi:transmembrane sensor